MMALQEKPDFRAVDKKLIEDIEKSYLKINLQEKVSANVTILTDSCATITLRLGTFVAQATLDTPVLSAQNKPLTEEMVRKQMNKTGQSPFIWESLEIQLSKDAFLPVQQLNQLRRQGIQALEEVILASYRRKMPLLLQRESQLNRAKSGSEGISQLTVSVLTAEQLSVVLHHKEITKVLLEWKPDDIKKLADAASRCHRAGKLCYLQLPHIFRASDRNKLLKQMEDILTAKIDGIVVRNLDEIGFLRALKLSIPIQCDASVYVWNHMARDFIKKFLPSDEQGNVMFTAPLELNNKELADIGCADMECIVYGYLPMMVSAGCIRKTTTGCTGKTTLSWLKDRKNQYLPVLNFCNSCYNIIYNSVPMVLLDKGQQVQKLQPASIRAAFTIETSQQVEQVLQWVISAFAKGESVQVDIPFTRGHFARGVR
jgi:putative protease